MVQGCFVLRHRQKADLANALIAFVNLGAIHRRNKSIAFTGTVPCDCLTRNISILCPPTGNSRRFLSPIRLLVCTVFLLVLFWVCLTIRRMSGAVSFSVSRIPCQYRRLAFLGIIFSIVEAAFSNPLTVGVAPNFRINPLTVTATLLKSVISGGAFRKIIQRQHCLTFVTSFHRNNYSSESP